MSPGPPPQPAARPRDRRLTRIAGPSALVLFGVTGDLAKKKLLPAMYDLAQRGLLPPAFSLVGFGRRSWSDEEFADYVRAAVEASSRTTFDETVWDQFQGGLRFVSGAFDDEAAYVRLDEVLAELETSRGTRGTPRSTSPSRRTGSRPSPATWPTRAWPTGRSRPRARGAAWSSRSPSATTWPARRSSML